MTEAQFLVELVSNVVIFAHCHILASRPVVEFAVLIRVERLLATAGDLIKRWPLGRVV
jgi:hypothetical protein